MFDPKGWALVARLAKFDSSGKPSGELHPPLQWYLKTQAETELQAAKAA